MREWWAIQPCRTLFPSVLPTFRLSSRNHPDGVSASSQSADSLSTEAEQFLGVPASLTNPSSRVLRRNHGNSCGSLSLLFRQRCTHVHGCSARSGAGLKSLGPDLAGKDLTCMSVLFFFHLFYPSGVYLFNHIGSSSRTTGDFAGRKPGTIRMHTPRNWT